MRHSICLAAAFLVAAGCGVKDSTPQTRLDALADEPIRQPSSEPNPESEIALPNADPAISKGGKNESATVESIVLAPENFKGQTLALDVQLSGEVIRGPARYRLTVKSSAGKVVGSELKSNPVVFVTDHAFGDRTFLGFKASGWYSAHLTAHVEKENGRWFIRVTACDLAPLQPKAPIGESVTLDALAVVPEKYEGKLVRLEGVSVRGYRTNDLYLQPLGTKHVDTYPMKVTSKSGRVPELSLVKDKLCVAGPLALVRRLTELGSGEHRALVFGTLSRVEGGAWLLRATSIELFGEGDMVARSIESNTYANLIRLGDVEVPDTMGDIKSMTYSPDGTMVKLVGEKATVDVDARSGKVTMVPLPVAIKQQRLDKHRVATDPTGDKQLWDDPLAISGVEGTPKVRVNPEGKYEEPYALGPHGKAVAITRRVGWKMSVSIIKAESGKETTTIKWPYDARSGGFGVKLLAFSHDGTRLAIGGLADPRRDSSILVADTATGKILTTLDSIDIDSIKRLEYSPDGKSLRAVRDPAHEFLAWDTSTWKRVPQPPRKSQFESVRSADGKRSASRMDNGFGVVDVGSNRTIASSSDISLDTRDPVIALSPAGDIVVTRNSRTLTFMYVSTGLVTPELPTADDIQNSPGDYEGKLVTLEIVSASSRIERVKNMAVLRVMLGSPSVFASRLRAGNPPLVAGISLAMAEKFIGAYTADEYRPVRMTARVESVLDGADRIWIARVVRIEFLDLAAKITKALIDDLPMYSRPEWYTSADFIPFKPPVVRTYRTEAYFPNDTTMVSIREEAFKTDGHMISTILKTALLQNGKPGRFSDVKMKIGSESSYRIYKGFVERKWPAKDDEQAPWEPILKIGAKAGEIWESKSGDKLVARSLYKIEGFEKSVGGSLIVRVRMQFFVDGKQISEGLTKYEFAVGRIEEDAWIFDTDGRKRHASNTTLEK